MKISTRPAVRHYAKLYFITALSVDRSMPLHRNVSIIADRCRQTMIADGSCGMREFKSWVLSTMITKDPYESALCTIIASASADPDNRADLITTCLEKQYVRSY